MKILNENDFYKSSDLALCAAIFLYYPIDAIDRQNPRKANFIFKRDQGLDDLVENYWKGELLVNPQAYFNALRVIKARLYGEE